MLPDPQLKKERGYVDPKTKVWPDGREVLAGEDWKERVTELSLRCHGFCEHTDKNNVRCHRWADDPHHIKPRWPKRDDRLDNLQALCRFHHDLMDKRKIGGRKHHVDQFTAT